jgi:hypothetical protein
MTWVERMLRKYVPLKEIGWKQWGETFTRFILLKTRWFAVYVHKLDAPLRPPMCHDHPWHFWAFVLGHGYYEEMNGKVAWRGAGSVLYRTARSNHNTITKEGRPNWSIIIVSKRVRDWAKTPCDPPDYPHWLLEKK